jgi:hypothetical protein
VVQCPVVELAPIRKVIFIGNHLPASYRTDFMSLKAQLEAIIYAAETPITLEQMVAVGERVA